MIRTKRIAALALGAAVGLVWLPSGWAQDAPSAGPPRAEESLAPKPPPADDFEGLRPKPPRDGEFGGPPHKPPRDGEFGGPVPRPMREGGFRPPLPDHERRGELSHRPPLGPPRWPHEDWESLEKNDPEMYKLLKEDADLERQTREMALQYRRAPKEQRAAIRQRVEQLADKHFDVRQQRRSLELKRLDEDLKRLREALDRREKSRKELVERRVSELLGSDDDVRF